MFCSQHLSAVGRVYHSYKNYPFANNWVGGPCMYL